MNVRERIWQTQSTHNGMKWNFSHSCRLCEVINLALMS